LLDCLPCIVQGAVSTGGLTVFVHPRL
jgi:hypothetical protein